ncbi:hypothetical protein BDW62DRAFT_210617 [Aspergillus aurantiobrunneus]
MAVLTIALKANTAITLPVFLAGTAAANPTGANYNVGLENTENGIVCRFPPEPSGRGVLISRFDDTNPSKESQEFQNSILYDLSLLAMYDACIKLIKKLMQDQRMKGVAGACRDMSVEETLTHFQEMKSGSPDGLEWCIRAKISIDNVNKALRDPVIYRCNHQPHHRTGTTWKMYPTYDFCAPYLNSVESVTHALRTNEYHDQVEIWDFSRINFVRTVLSKRKLSKIVGECVVWGSDDPQFILKQGPSQNIVNMDWTQFWAVNMKYIDPVAARYTAISKLNAVTAYIDGIAARIILSKQGNAIVVSITSDPQTGTISTLQLKLVLESHSKKTKRKLRRTTDISLYLTQPSDFCTEVWADCNVSTLPADEIIQFDRTGYYRVDQAYREGLPAVMFNIPTGKWA